ncbi:hypothetical protein HRI_004526700 [Hibiscus trionum]|uniref:Uncharacterized protein n=1 Tax=Hibiscus trionum TaxID=183268 RepID=A0A9W7MR94_HIBTR|nr:hypothetical protein HRI_004526700 [Hibiscus trionum]
MGSFGVVSGRPPDDAVQIPVQASLERDGVPLGDGVERESNKGRGSAEDVREDEVIGEPLSVDICINEASLGGCWRDANGGWDAEDSTYAGNWAGKALVSGYGCRERWWLEGYGRTRRGDY